MSLRFSALFSLFKARLSRKIVWWVFASIVAIEFMILIPSYTRREEELLLQLEEVSGASIETTLRLVQEGMYPETKLLKKLETLTEDPLILGVTIYRTNGELIRQYGEIPALSFDEIENMHRFVSRRSWSGDRYDVAWSAVNLGIDCIFIVRHDAASVQPELYAFALRVAGLVLIISVFVTSVTIFVLGVTVIYPILQLRDDLICAADALSQETPSNPDFYSFSVQRQDELGEVMQAFCNMFYRVRDEILKRKKTEVCLRNEQEKSERLLLNILPKPIAYQLKQGNNNIAEGFADVTILFADIVGFTPLSTRMDPKELVNLLNQMFSAFDGLSEKHGLEKIKTIGDSYMVAGGLPIPRKNHAEAIAEMALDMQQEVAQFSAKCGEPLSIRIGINTGPVVAGVIGTKKFIYDLWGDAVNTASRMESHGIAGCIQVTDTTYKRLKGKYKFKERGSIKIKGKGLMTTYLLSDRHF